MNRTKRKDYTLYLKVNGKEIELLKGTLSEIDDFTTYFMNASSMCRKFTDCNIDNSKYEIFIRSCKNNRYPVLYYNHRKLLNSSNVNQIMAHLKQIPKEELISFLDNCTPIIYYISNGKDDNRIPLCELYNNLTKGLDYSYSLNKYIKSDYKNYRCAATYVIDRYDLNLEDFPFVNIDKVKEIISNIHNSIINILPKINEKIKLEDSIDVEYLFDESIETLDERIYSIINDDRLDTYEKEEELELLIDDDYDKLRIAKNMLYQKKM